MYLYTFLLVASVTRVCVSSPARLKIPEVNVSSPAEINNLNRNDIDMASIIGSSTDVESTIREVEALINSDPKLPRLTRGEILDIIDNITKSDEAKLKKTKQRDQKAIMVVMPYSPENAQNGDVQALYTKPPVTHLIGDKQKPPNKRKRPTRKPQYISSPVYTPTTTTTTTTSTTTIKFTPPEIITQPPSISEVPFKPIRRRTTPKPTTTRFPNHKYPDDKPFIVKSTPVFTTSTRPPLSDTGINIINPPKFHSKPYKTSSKIEKPLYRPKPTSSPSSPSPIIMEDMQLPQGFKEVLTNLDILIKENPKYSSQYDSLSPLPTKKPNENVHDILASINAFNPTTTSQPDIQQVANNLTPDMKELLMNFGLLPDPNKKPTIAQPTKSQSMSPSSEIKAESYSSFKPLPNSNLGTADEGMEELLARFGLGKNLRTQKAISQSKPKNELSTVNVEAVPDNLKTIFKDLGITYKDIEDSKGKKKQHVFNPAQTQYATQDELAKLDKLMSVIKQLEKLNGSVSEQDLKHIDLDGLKQLVGSLNVPLDQQLGPNPLDFDASILKNEVKRQQSTTTTTVASVATEPKNPSLADLEDSFGGSSDTASETIVTPATEAPKKTGFYYLVDWNTFLDIDNQKGKRVNLRFQPTIGDPKRFLSVSVP